VTATFSHLDGGRPADTWDQLIAGLTRLPSPRSGDSVVVLAAHPDDETLGAGGLIASAAAAGAAVTVLVATCGEASHPHSPTHTGDMLAARRRSEVARAVRVLAPQSTLHLLEFPDGRLDEHEAALSEILTELATAATLLVSPWWGDGHPDHAAAARAAATAAQRLGVSLWQYPIWAWHRDAPLRELTASLGRLPLPPVALDTKLSALSEHESQHRPLSGLAGDEAILSPAMLGHFSRRAEVFVTESAAQPEYFERLYRDAHDPWELGERFYERRKRELLMAALPRPRFARAFEPGCATGLLTAALARRCDAMVAWDVAPAALAQARRAVAGASHVRLEPGSIPDTWPDGGFDLIVISEVGYYCPDLDALTRRVEGSLTANGVLVACHWLHDAPLHPHSAETVHATLGRSRRRIATHREADFVLDVWTADGRSVAQFDGIVG
jgi:LmbE family N-acetylglucosaminyl deacetylase/SAM-dependent methyltransferase